MSAGTGGVEYSALTISGRFSEKMQGERAGLKVCTIGRQRGWSRGRHGTAWPPDLAWPSFAGSATATGGLRLCRNVKAICRKLTEDGINPPAGEEVGTQLAENAGSAKPALHQEKPPRRQRFCNMVRTTLFYIKNYLFGSIVVFSSLC